MACHGDRPAWNAGMAWHGDRIPFYLLYAITSSFKSPHLLQVWSGADPRLDAWRGAAAVAKAAFARPPGGGHGGHHHLAAAAVGAGTGAGAGGWRPHGAPLTRAEYEEMGAAAAARAMASPHY